jgi:hypothetical protein
MRLRQHSPALPRGLPNGNTGSSSSTTPSNNQQHQQQQGPLGPQPFRTSPLRQLPGGDSGSGGTDQVGGSRATNGADSDVSLTPYSILAAKVSAGNEIHKANRICHGIIYVIDVIPDLGRSCCPVCCQHGVGHERLALTHSSSLPVPLPAAGLAARSAPPACTLRQQQLPNAAHGPASRLRWNSSSSSRWGPPPRVATRPPSPAPQHHWTTTAATAPQRHTTSCHRRHSC